MKIFHQLDLSKLRIKIFMKIFIQIPCFNEELQIKNIIEDIRKSLDTNNYDYEIVIIDDGSTDRTIAIAKENGVKNILSL